MQTLTLNNGPTIDGHILEDANKTAIYVYLDNFPLTDGFVLLSNPEKTRKIVANSYGHEYIYEGYTTLSAISDEYGNCNAVLRRS